MRSRGADPSAVTSLQKVPKPALFRLFSFAAFNKDDDYNFFDVDDDDDDDNDDDDGDEDVDGGDDDDDSDCINDGDNDVDDSNEHAKKFLGSYDDDCNFALSVSSSNQNLGAGCTE